MALLRVPATRPKLQGKFARNKAQSRYPSLWDDAVLLAAPSLGDQGRLLYNWAGKGIGPGVILQDSDSTGRLYQYVNRPIAEAASSRPYADANGLLALSLNEGVETTAERVTF